MSLRIGVALGGGGARGLAHIAMLQAFDELGLRPHCLAGTSIGALVGAAYASGISAREIAEHAVDVLANRVRLAQRLLSGRQSNPTALVSFRAFGPVMINGMRLTELFFPQGVCLRLEDTPIRFSVSATDFYAHKEMAITRGPLREAVAASISLPGIIAAPRIDGRYVIDGGMVNPVPVNHIDKDTDLTVAIDVTGGPVPGLGRDPGNRDLWFGAAQIMQRQIVGLRNREHPPDILIEPAVDKFRVLEFFKIRAILAAAVPAKERLKRKLALAIESKG
ncbi:MAG: patatin-like phospholipase family protein [Pseudomonadota bacterium]|nr:patatin-like phospholipase family protein [Pseudomonadota bacterium]